MRPNGTARVAFVCFALYIASLSPQIATGTRPKKKNWPVSFSQEELRKRLSPLQYHVTQERGTESAFRGEFTEHKTEGTYTCVVCGAPLFRSDTKFDSGSGWPAFFDLIKQDSVVLTDDYSFGMHRVETTCSQCGAHLGHLFDDGPRPTRKRYCINSASLAFQPKEQATPLATEENRPKEQAPPLPPGENMPKEQATPLPLGENMPKEQATPLPPGENMPKEQATPLPSRGAEGGAEAPPTSKTEL